MGAVVVKFEIGVVIGLEPSAGAEALTQEVGIAPWPEWQAEH